MAFTLPIFKKFIFFFVKTLVQSLGSRLFRVCRLLFHIEFFKSLCTLHLNKNVKIISCHQSINITINNASKEKQFKRISLTHPSHSIPNVSQSLTFPFYFSLYQARRPPSFPRSCPLPIPSKSATMRQRWHGSNKRPPIMVITWPSIYFWW